MRSALSTVAATLTACALVLGGCASEESEPSVGTGEEQDVTERGPLAFNEAAESKFTQDFEYHAYTFEVAPGSRVSLEITQQGTAAALDTVMVLYGPANADGERERIAVDYDSGWGGHSKLKDQTLVEGGKYVVTVGTADGLDRGHYRLLLTCAAGSCASDETPLQLTEGEPNTEFMETLNNYDSEYCWRWGRAFSYPEDTDNPSLVRAGASIVELFTEEHDLQDYYGAVVEYGGEITHAQFDSWLQYSGLDRGTFEGAVGNLEGDDYRVGEVVFEYECAASVTCSGSIMVAHIPSWNEVWTVEFGCGDE